MVSGSLENSTLKRKGNKAFSSAVIRHPQTPVALTVDSRGGGWNHPEPALLGQETAGFGGSLPSGEMNLIGFLNNSMPSASGLTSCYSSRVTCLRRGSKITLIAAGPGIRWLVRVPAFGTECESNDHDLLNSMPQNTWHRPWPSADAQKLCGAGWNFGRASCFSFGKLHGSSCLICRG